jgi:hypothetical protein
VSGNGSIGEAEYADLVGRIHSTVVGRVPPGSSVLVISKGDVALVSMPGLSAAHFPQDGAGEYAGHHPLDSAAATTSLEDLRRHGAEYLVIPATARWWLDHYAEFATHLATHAELVVDEPDTCLIYGLERLGSEAARTGLDAPVASVDQIRDYLERLLAPDAELVVLEEEADRVSSALAPLKTIHLGGGREDAALTELRRLVERGGDYLVVPRAEDDWFDHRSDIGAQIADSCPKVADQRHLCRVFDLDGMRGFRP